MAASARETAERTRARLTPRGGEARPRLEATVRELEAAPNRLRLAYALTVLAWIELDAGDVTSAHEHAERAVGVASALSSTEALEMTALARFALARALGSSRSDRARAVTLAKQAEDALPGRGEERRRELEEVRAWLAEHGAQSARRPA